jgi:hypothetical protein
LVEEESISITTHLNTKEEVQSAKIFDGKGLTRSVDDVVQQIWCRCNQYDVINIDKEVCRLSAMAIDEERELLELVGTKPMPRR